MFNNSLTSLVLVCALAPAVHAAPLGRGMGGLDMGGGFDDGVGVPRLVLAASRRANAEGESAGDMPGRYAVMRDKRDTGCMLTLDRARVRGGARAQLAPGCRDQGIVIFDPSTWAIVKGELVLTARAGHKTRLLGDGVGAWRKAPGDGKPLGLKKL